MDAHTSRKCVFAVTIECGHIHEADMEDAIDEAQDAIGCALEAEGFDVKLVEFIRAEETEEIFEEEELL